MVVTLHTETKGLCTIISSEDFPMAWIQFDPRYRGITENAAGDDYQHLQKIAGNIKFESSYRYTVDLTNVSNGTICIVKNKSDSIKTNYTEEKAINLIVDLINIPVAS